MGSTNNQQVNKPKFSIQEQLKLLEEKGVSFVLYPREKAGAYLEQNNYFFRIKSYAKNYDKTIEGKYINLDFAYLVEFATLDLYFRRLLLSWSLDVEHHLKMILLQHFNSNANEDGYRIVNDFFIEHPDIKREIHNKSQSNSFVSNLLKKYKNNLALWNLIEVLSFGNFMKFFIFYFSQYSQNKKYTKYHSMAFAVRVLRNASAHNNCMFNTLRIPYDVNFTPNKYTSSCVAKIPTISNSTRKKILLSPILHDFIALLFLFDEICNSKTLKRARMKDLLVFLKRCKKHKVYFLKENLLTSRFQAIQKIVLFLIKK